MNITDIEITAEIVRLQTILADTGKVHADKIGNPITRIDIMADLFELSIHRKNPQPDYDLALECARFLFEHVPDKKLYYANWGNMIKNHLRLIVVKESLEEILAKLSDKGENYHSQNKKLTSQIENLKSTIRKQSEVIKKLQQMDMQMNGN